MNNSNLRVVTFGELLMRLDCPGHERFVQADQFDVSYTGGEANVAVAIAQWGLSSSIVSKVPVNALGTACLNHFQKYQVDTSNVVRDGRKLGILFVESGSKQRSTNVVYDRQTTSFWDMTPSDVDWKTVLRHASWLHFTGTALITPSSQETIIQGLKIARSLSVPTSFDVSFRSALFDVDTAREKFNVVARDIHLFLGSEQDAKVFFGIKETGNECLHQLHDHLGCRWTAFSNRVVDDHGNNLYSARMFDGEQIHHSKVYQTSNVDRIGTGDAFAAGLIYSFLNRRSHAESLEFATAAAVLKHTVPGDFALLTTEEIEDLATGRSTGRIRR